MTHHLLPEMGRDWLAGLTNCFLIRDPAEVIASYVRKNDDPAIEDFGFAQQAGIFDWVRQRSGRVPPVIDAADVLRDPRRMLGLLCEAVGVQFDAAMLSWPPGPRRPMECGPSIGMGKWRNRPGFGRIAREPSRWGAPGSEARRRECYDRVYQDRLR